MERRTAAVEKAGQEVDPSVQPVHDDLRALIGSLRARTREAPDDADAWHRLGLALLEDGDLDGATEALRSAVDAGPAGTAALTDLAHVLHATGDRAEAIGLLSRAAEESPGDAAILRSLVDMHRSGDESRAALQRAEQLLALRPDDVLAVLDVATLRLAVGDHDGAIEAFGRLRELDGVAADLVGADSKSDASPVAAYAYHGMIEAEVHRERWRAALDLAIAATAVDRHELTTDLLAYVSTRLFGPGDRPSPSWPELAARLAEQHRERRRDLEQALAAERAS